MENPRETPATVKPSRKKRRKEGIILFLLALPFLVLVFLFSYLPLYGWSYAFFDYRPPLKLAQCAFVGLQWFRMLFRNGTQVGQIVQVLENTFGISGLNIVTSILPMFFAIFLAEVKVPWFKKSVQTLTTLPNFISWVLVYSLAYALFSSVGPFNQMLFALHLTKNPVLLLQSDQHTWLAMCLWGMWKGLGWGAILYLAALSGIDQELYEAARVDGAGRFSLMWHITIPSLLPTFFVLLMLSIANFLNNGMDQYFVFQNAFNKTHIQVLDLYVYNIGMQDSSYSLATAVSIMKTLVSLVLLLVVNNASRLVRGETIV